MMHRKKNGRVQENIRNVRYLRTAEIEMAVVRGCFSLCGKVKINFLKCIKKKIFLHLTEPVSKTLQRKSMIIFVNSKDYGTTPLRRKCKMNEKKTAAQSQKLMVFVLTMSLYGLATRFTELIPKFQVGIVEFSVEYFLFIPLVLAILFDPMSAALGAATGELVFSEIMLGQFGGLGELEKFITGTIGVYIAGRMVRNQKNTRMVGIAAITGTALQLFMGMAVDILKVQFAVSDFEAVPGLPESVFATEGFAFLNDLLFSGILFCLLPTLFLVPRLYGKIEPLLGMRPRTEETSLGGISGKAVLGVLIGFAAAVGAEMLAESGLPLIDWEASWAESGTAMAAGLVAAAAMAVIVLLIIRRNAEVQKSRA